MAVPMPRSPECEVRATVVVSGAGARPAHIGAFPYITASGCKLVLFKGQGQRFGRRAGLKRTDPQA